MFGTTTLQPYAEYELEAQSKLTVTPGVKLAYVQAGLHAVRRQRQDGRQSQRRRVEQACRRTTTRGCRRSTRTTSCSRTGRSTAQYGKGQNIPPTSIFDVKGALVATLPKPILTEHRPVRLGLEVEPRDARRGRVPHQASRTTYSSTIRPGRRRDAATSSRRTSMTQGVEAESTILLGARPRRLPERHGRHARSYTDTEPVGAEHAERHGDHRPDVQPGAAGTSASSASASARCTTTTAPRIRPIADRSVQHHEPVRELLAGRIVASFAHVEHSVRGQQPDRQPRHHGGHARRRRRPTRPPPATS